MLIGIDASRTVAAQRTGTENYALFLTRALINLGSSHRFRLYFNTPPAPGLLPANDQVEHCVVPFPRLWTHIRLAWEVALHPPDILFIPSHVLPLIHRPPSVVTVHDLGYLYYPEAHTRFQRWYLNWSTRYSAHGARRIIADSQATSRDLQERYHITPEKITVAYPAGTTRQCQAPTPIELGNIRQRYRTSERYVLYLGSLQPRKNLPTLIRAFSRAAREGTIEPDINLVLAGKQGWLPEALAGIARAEGMGERVILPGYVPEADAVALMQGALAFVLPSYYEGFGLPVLEAMACGVPVICSNVSSLPEVAGDAALLVDPHDTPDIARTLARVCNDTALRQQLSQRGLERAAQFTWEACARQVLAVLEAAEHDCGN